MIKVSDFCLAPIELDILLDRSIIAIALDLSPNWSV
jgi:hypothetical protein